MKTEKKPSSFNSNQNPFETKWAVLAGTSRKRASLPSGTRNKRNVFADRRIGEDDPNLPEEERYLARLQRERTRRNRKRARFSLADDDDGQAAPDEMRSKVSLLRDDYDETEGIDDKLDEALERQDGEGSDDELLTVKQPDTEASADNEHRTHQEIMNEVVLKSKMYKAQRQQEKFEMDEQTEKLDQDLQALFPLLQKSGADFTRKQQQIRESAKQVEKGPATIFDTEKPDSDTRAPTAKKSFHYEFVYQQLASEKRARPSSRLLTEEEKAEKEMEELQELEAKRKERMQSAVDSDIEDDNQLQTSDRKNRAGGDDIDDGFELDIDNSNDEDHDVEEEEENDDEEEDMSPANLQPNVQTTNNVSLPQKSRKARIPSEDDPSTFDPDSLVWPEGRKATIADDEIPYMFKDCPASRAQLQNLFENKTIAQRNLTVTRLLKCFAPSLNPTVNSAKLDGLVSCMLERVADLCGVSSTQVNVAIKEIDMLLVHIHTLGGKREELISGWAREKLAAAFSSLTSSTQESSLSERWKVSTILALRGIGRLFPASDLRHPVSTPLALLLSEALELKRIQSVQDVALGIVISYILLEQMAEGGRYSGQLTTFLKEVVAGSCKSSDSVLASAMQELREHGGKITGGEEVSTLRISGCMNVPDTPTEKLGLQRKIALSAAALIQASGLSGDIGHMDIIYEKVDIKQVMGYEARRAIEEEIAAAKTRRQPLSLYSKKSNVVIAKALNPKFSAENGVFRKKPRTTYSAQRSGDMSASAIRVRRALKKEERGLARDVRRAAVHSAQVRARGDAERAERREKRAREARAFLEEQQATWNKAVKRQRKLSGKKW